MTNHHQLSTINYQLSTTIMVNLISFFLLWIGFISYAFFFAPPDTPDTLTLIINLSTGNWEGINPYIISLFNLMGILPIIYASLLIIDGKGQKIMATPFVIGSFFVGAFALLPYFALRQPNPKFEGEKNLLLKVLDSRILGILVTIATLVLLSFAIFKGDWNNFIEQWQNSRFIHVMSLDFCLLSLLLPLIIKDDLAKRGIDNQTIFLSISFLPLIGPLIYLCLRPNLADSLTYSTD
jgi:hypothetical protein